MKKQLSLIAVVIALTLSVLSTSTFSGTNSEITPICPIQVCTPAS